MAEGGSVEFPSMFQKTSIVPRDVKKLNANLILIDFTYENATRENQTHFAVIDSGAYMNWITSTTLNRLHDVKIEGPRLVEIVGAGGHSTLVLGTTKN